MFNHTPLIIIIPTVEKYISSSKYTIIKDSKEKLTFIKELSVAIRNINTSNILDINSLDRAVNKFTNIVENTWLKNSKIINIIKHSKSWWNNNCSRDLEIYRILKSLEDWKQFQRTVKNTKH